MSDKERYGERDLTYSKWHRMESTKRFLSAFEAWRLGMIDIDDVEYCRWCSMPLHLIETAMDVGQQIKATTVTANLARFGGLPVSRVFYKITNSGSNDKDIERFRVLRILGKDAGQEIVMAPREYARFLFSFHQDHERDCPKKAAPHG